MNAVTEDFVDYIVCPICGAKTFVKKGTSGEVTSYCKCGRILDFDYDTMVAKAIKPKRGLSQRLSTKKRK